MKKYIFILSLILLFLSGCTYQMGDGLLSLPKLPQEYVELQKLYDQILDTGATYVSAKTGSNRQSVQLADLDADGENEVISFFKKPDGAFSVYVHKKNGKSYSEIGNILGVGKNIKSVEYINISATGEKALMLSWEVEEMSQAALSVYTLSNGVIKNVLDLQNLGYFVVDIDMDAKEDILAIYRNSEEKTNIAEMYSFSGTECAMVAQTQMSIESDKIVNITSGMTASGKKGVFIDSSTIDSEYVTDILVYSNGVLSNESIDNESGSANITKRHINIFSSDIDGDGIIEIPRAKMFIGYTDPLSSDTRWKINWSKIEKGKILANPLRTFYNSLEGWYLILPNQWGDEVSAIINTEANISKTTFFVPHRTGKEKYSMSYSENNSIVSIYVITGDTREIFEKHPDIVILKQTETTTYACKTYENDYTGYSVTGDEIVRLMRFVKNTDWSMEDLSK